MSARQQAQNNDKKQENMWKPMEFNPQFIHFHHLELHKFPISQILYYRTAIQELCIKYTKTKRFWIQICKFHMINDERRDMLQ